MEGQLRALCGEFEQVMLASLVPQSPGFVSGISSENADGDSATNAGLSAGLFPQVFAAALERAGGIGLSAAFFRSLGGHA